MGLPFKFFIILFLFCPVIVQSKSLTNDNIKALIIQESILSYPGKCPCPYSYAKNGMCGKRSAYSKPGGASPICYPDQINNQMIDNFRKRHNR